MYIQRLCVDREDTPGEMFGAWKSLLEGQRALNTELKSLLTGMLNTTTAGNV